MWRCTVHGSSPPLSVAGACFSGTRSSLGVQGSVPCFAHALLDWRGHGGCGKPSHKSIGLGPVLHLTGPCLCLSCFACLYSVLAFPTVHAIPLRVQCTAQAPVSSEFAGPKERARSRTRVASGVSPHRLSSRFPELQVGSYLLRFGRHSGARGPSACLGIHFSGPLH